MSSETGISKYLMHHLEDGLQPGQVIDQPYLVQRGAVCNDGTPAMCKFSGVANEKRTGLPKENAGRAHSVTKIEARIILPPPARIEVVKEISYPNAKQP